MFQSIKMQTAVLLKKKSVLLMYFLMLALVLGNFTINLLNSHGKDRIQLYHPVKVLLLSTWSYLGFYFTQFYPLLVVIPVAFSFLSDRNSREIVFIQSRVGRKHYYIGKLISAFLVTFLVFTIPLLLEILLSLIAYPLSAVGDPSNFGIYNLPAWEGEANYLFHSLWFYNGYLYAVVMIILSGITSSILATFALAISTFSFMKYKIFVFIPVYVLLQTTYYLDQAFGNHEYSVDYFGYLQIFDTQKKSELVYICFLLAIALLSTVIAAVKIRKDEIL